MEWLGFGLAALLVLVGLVGTILPLLPGVPLVFAGLLMAAAVDGFRHVGVAPLVAVGLLMLAASVVDLLAGALAARGAGASWGPALGAGLGAMVGLFFGLWGLLFGPLAGAALFDYGRRRDGLAALKVGLATWLGLLVGGLVKFVLALGMLGVFACAWWL